MSVYSDECLGRVVIFSIAESDLKFVSQQLVVSGGKMSRLVSHTASVRERDIFKNSGPDRISDPQVASGNFRVRNSRRTGSCRI